MVQIAYIFSVKYFCSQNLIAKNTIFLSLKRLKGPQKQPTKFVSVSRAINIVLSFTGIATTRHDQLRINSLSELISIGFDRSET